MIAKGGLTVEQKRLRKLLNGKIVRRIWRQRKKELGIEFVDGTRLFVDWMTDHLDVSVTGGTEE